jgi:hypothetical protein
VLDDWVDFGVTTNADGCVATGDFSIRSVKVYRNDPESLAADIAENGPCVAHVDMSSATTAVRHAVMVIGWDENEWIVASELTDIDTRISKGEIEKEDVYCPNVNIILRS